MTYCPLPFKHVFVEPRGVKPCCSYTGIADVTVEQWINSSELKILQNNILQGKIDPGCQSCLQNEQQYNTSTRLGALKDYPDHYQHTNIDYVDYRSTNICNFKCRTCEPYFSNGIAQEARRHQSLLNFYSIPQDKTASTDSADRQWIIDNLNQLNKLMFTGGEPTRIPAVKEILEEIRQRNLPDLQVQLITNGSFTDPYWRELAISQPNINWTVSIDAVGPAAEIIRHGTDWQLVESNIRFLAENCHSLNFSTVISKLNVFQLRPLLEFTKSIQTDYTRPNGRTQFIQFCVWPNYFNPYNWPSNLKAQAEQYVRAIINDNVHEDHNDILTSLADRIHSNQFDIALWAQGEQLNDTHDSIRNENHQLLFGVGKI